MIENSIPEKAFNIDYVLKTTTKHMLKSVNISIGKTFDRLPEFKNNPEKSLEVFSTLAILHKMRKNLDDTQYNYSGNIKEGATHGN